MFFYSMRYIYLIGSLTFYILMLLIAAFVSPGEVYSDSTKKILYKGRANKRSVANRTVNESLPFGKKYALLIGVQNFKISASNQLKALPQLNNDLDELEKILNNIGYKVDKLDVRAEKKPTRKEIIERIRSYKKSNYNIFLIYYTGHGIENYLCAYDYDPDPVLSLSSRALNVSYFFSAVEELSHVKQKILILDTCHSGSAIKGGDAEINFESLSKGGSFSLFTSCQSNEQSYVNEQENMSYFTQYLVKGLEGEADGSIDGKPDCFIELQELHKYVSSKVSEEVKKRGRTQNPNLTLCIKSGKPTLAKIKSDKCKEASDDAMSTDVSSEIKKLDDKIELLIDYIKNSKPKENNGDKDEIESLKKQLDNLRVEFEKIKQQKVFIENDKNTKHIESKIKQIKEVLVDIKTPEERDVYLGKHKGRDITMTFVEIPSGKIKIKGQSSTISKFWMGKYEVTQEQWLAVMGENPSAFKDCAECDRHPVENVSWNDVQVFLNRLNGADDDFRVPTGCESGKNVFQPSVRYRLPEEIEWMYAACGGKAITSTYYWGDDPDIGCQYANVGDEEARSKETIHKRLKIHNCNDGYAQTAPVDMFKSNSFGLHNMFGNVGEWVRDCESCLKEECMKHIIMGGSWMDGPMGTVLFKERPSTCSPIRGKSNVGFRILRATP
ncbi:hypothetical protein DENIS_4047 [Desulfonema ishimotonii]|uniref:Caspase family p20 domain-containing protein n=1 Tax=Desulfonema ishimotonii TaxID=45657 RepID=A0A401G1E2_9BACT|nr:SUMF1/EgtB/PvdO family nonheme iron enzyme [Desulfonema ishimotonii]GBC63058.1 hypothetical protein DENIS_4047 [Desulfonema ishimotonii]